jgi:hypothetical protein
MAIPTNKTVSIVRFICPAPFTSSRQIGVPVAILPRPGADSRRKSGASKFTVLHISNSRERLFDFYQSRGRAAPQIQALQGTNFPYLDYATCIAETNWLIDHSDAICSLLCSGNLFFGRLIARAFARCLTARTVIR